MAPSLFSGFGATGATSTSQPGASIFSTTNPTQSSGTTATTAQTQTPLGFSFLGQQQKQQEQQQTQQQQSQQAGQGQQQTQAQSLQSTQPAFFNSLLERGKKRPFSTTGQDAGLGELPSLQLGLDDIRRKARELGSGAAQRGRDSKA